MHPGHHLADLPFGLTDLGLLVFGALAFVLAGLVARRVLALRAATAVRVATARALEAASVLAEDNGRARLRPVPEPAGGRHAREQAHPRGDRQGVVNGRGARTA